MSGMECRICGEIGHGGCAPTLKEMAVIDAACAAVAAQAAQPHWANLVLAVRALDGGDR